MGGDQEGKQQIRSWRACVRCFKKNGSSVLTPAGAYNDLRMVNNQPECLT